LGFSDKYNVSRIGQRFFWLSPHIPSSCFLSYKASPVEPSAQSPLSLRDNKKSPDQRPIESRVQSLKIAKSDKISEQSSSSRFAWIVSLLFAIACGYLLYRDDEIMSMVGLRKVEVAKKEPIKPKDGKDPAAKSGAGTDKGSNSSVTNSTSGSAAKIALPDSAMALESRGYVIAKHQVLVSPQVSGRLMRLNIEEGRRVTKGEILAEVDTTEYVADLNQLKGALQRNRAELSELETGSRPQEIASAQAELTEQQEILPQFKSEYERLVGLVATNTVSVSEFEQSRSNFFGAKRRIERLTLMLDMLKEGPRKERIEMARAAVTQAEAALAKSQWRLDNCTIRAPISGTILKKNAEEGNLVNPVAFNGSYSICDIADLSDLEIDLNIQERDVSKVFVGQRCEVKPEAFSKKYEATVSRLMPIADRAKGAIPVRVAVRVPEEEQGVYLKPEMSAVVVFYGSKPE
jgi:multidrug resistance efflux pump